MHRTRIKVCGITRRVDLHNAISAGVDAVGLVFYPPSPRSVTLETAEKISTGCPAFISVVALFVDPDSELVDNVVKSVRPQLLQFHGSETRDFCERSGLPYMKALRVAEGVDLMALAQSYPTASALLLDTYVRGVAGGTGQSFDWGVIPEDLSAPLVLAGGLAAENVGAAISAVHPYAVDVSGGVESEPGLKDINRMHAFVSAVRAADAV